MAYQTSYRYRSSTQEAPTTAVYDERFASQHATAGGYSSQSAVAAGGGYTGASYTQAAAHSSSAQSAEGLSGWSFLAYAGGAPVARDTRQFQTGPVWNDNLILSETHYHHGDHHHNHHQRHVHHFHDLHLLGSAEEILDLRGNPPVRTDIIPSDNPPQLKFRPDVLGRQAFEAGADQYFTNLSTKVEGLSSGAVAGRAYEAGSVGAREYAASSSARQEYVGGTNPRSRSPVIHEEEVVRRRFLP
eukprot:NODE_1304_length_1014_cov_536.679793_g1004_i0.p1 GENE.NODE_1304_length_1014_cov_536.679793_g1004_i0~~NODE_1304_length_1014_cov_536.679793_g1004_i0.p1  ORF type:complete len:244 (+),score=33.47 NODE_1304_length_1014_cov_536.679793_g1004_i0:57-788(+)